jgi:orotate phosphoribosyltransferase
MIDADLKGEIVKGFFDGGIVKVNFENPFTLASGKKSPLYFDHRRIYSYPKLRKQVTRAWANQLMGELESRNIRNVAIAGTATAGIAPALALADFLEVPFIYVRSAPKSHGTTQCVEGNLQLDRSYVVVDDMVTTGGSIVEAATKLREAGGSVAMLSSITTHNLLAAKKAMGDNTCFSLLTSLEILDTAHQLSLLSRADLESAKAVIQAL